MSAGSEDVLGARIAAQMNAGQGQEQGKGEKTVDFDQVRKESSKDVQKTRQQQLRVSHGLLLGFFGLVMCVLS